VRSLPDGVAQALLEYIENTDAEMEDYLQIDGGNNGNHSKASPEKAGPNPQSTFKIGDLCPECGQAAVVNEEGCRKCYACGYSEC
jgi:ribonucleoside-diphosphate reductase alpha chain